VAGVVSPEERARRLAEVEFKLTDLRQHMKHFAACVQQTVTAWEAWSLEWETRYVAEGLQEIEAAANAESRRHSEE
jgi:hypothetical protein